jgi:hypothetical protein
MADARQSVRERGKCDPSDALAIARVALRLAEAEAAVQAASDNVERTEAAYHRAQEALERLETAR